MSLSWRNLIHDRVRLAVTITGIVFAIVPIVVQFGLFLGFRDTSANIVEHSRADVWLCAPGTPHLNCATPIPQSRLYKVPGTADVATAQKYVVWVSHEEFVPSPRRRTSTRRLRMLGTTRC